MAGLKFKESVQSFINKHQLFEKHHKLLLAISGGPDSVALMWVLKELNFKVGLAHCNFRLRPGDAERDEDFVRNLAQENNLPFWSKSFDTEYFAKINKASIQMVARDLRYQWLEEQRKIHGFDFIAVAHHRNDQAETILMNIARGCGLEGLSGMAVKQNHIVRPLLFANKSSITSYLDEIKKPFRIDQSNFQTKYHRNCIRLDVIPRLEEINPLFVKHITGMAKKIEEAQAFVNEQIEIIRSDAISHQGSATIILASKILKTAAPSFVLYEILKKYGFKNEEINNILNAFHHQSGKLFFSATHRLVTDRASFILEPLKVLTNSDFIMKIEDFRFSFHIPEGWKLEGALSADFVKDPSVACINMAKIEFPLVLRKWKHGDIFYPLGLKGKKKVSDLLIDLKYSLPQKEKVYVLENGNGKIIWIVGVRLSDKFKVLPGDENFWRISISP